MAGNSHEEVVGHAERLRKQMGSSGIQIINSSSDTFYDN